jgi:arsenate reductase-like glutaredoxin family protein
LREHGFPAEEVNYAKTGLDAATVAKIVAAAGGVARVLNPRHEVAKARGWAEKPPSVAEFAAAVAKEPNLIRRPILIDGKRVLVGYDKTNREAWQALGGKTG